VTKAGDFAFNGVYKACSIFQFRAIGVTSDWVRVRIDEKNNSEGPSHPPDDVTFGKMSVGHEKLPSFAPTYRLWVLKKIPRSRPL